MTAGILEDSNVFRQPDDGSLLGSALGRSRSDTITRLGLGIKYDRTVSRQHVIAEVNLLDNDYRNNTGLDHVSGNAGARWLWQAGNYWSGELAYDFTRRLSGFADLRLAIKNLVDQETLTATAGYQLHPSWRLWGGVTDYKFENSSILLRANDSTITNTLVGLDYRSRADNTVGLLFRHSEGMYPFREATGRALIDNQYVENTTSVVWAWAPTWASQFDGRFGYTERLHEQFPQRDFDGPTFRMRYTWRPTGLLRFDTSAWRELWTAESETSNYVVASGIRISPVWSVTPMITVRGGLSYETRSYQGDPGIVIGVPVREDTLRTFQLGATYSPHRNVQLQLQFEAGDRESNRPGNQFDYNTVLFNARIAF